MKLQSRSNWTRQNWNRNQYFGFSLCGFLFDTWAQYSLPPRQ